MEGRSPSPRYRILYKYFHNHVALYDFFRRNGHKHRVKPLVRRKRKPDFFDAVGKAINWAPIKKFLNNKLNRKANVVGNPAYPALLMFKILLLQKWYKLSDPAMEEMLINHLGFLRFVGLSVEQDVPDETTICRFRNGLVSLGILEKVNEMILLQLEHAQILVREGAIVDASIIESACRQRKTVEVMPEDRKEDVPLENITPESTKIKPSNDVNTSTKSNENNNSKDETAPTESVKITYSKIEEIHLPEGSTVFADKGYTSANNRSFLKEKGLRDGIMYKAQKNKKISETEGFLNREISKFRYKVERSIGNLKQHFDLNRSRYIGLAKVEAELLMVGIAFNITKATKFIGSTG